MFWKTTTKESRECGENSINTLREPLIAPDEDFKVVSVRRSLISTAFRESNQKRPGSAGGGARP